MGLPARVVIRGMTGWGVNDPPARSFALESAQTWRQARKRPGAIRGYIRLGTPDNALGRATGTSDDACALCHDYRLDFRFSDNTLAGWLPSSNAAPYFSQYDNIEGDGTSGVAYTQSLAGEIVYFRTANDLITENDCHAVRLFLFKPPEDFEYPVVTVRFAPWQMEITRGGQAHLMRLRPGFTQTAEDDYQLLLQNPNPTALEQAAIDVARESLYRDIAPIDIDGGNNGAGSSHAWGRFLTFLFIPDTSGTIAVFDENKRYLGSATDSLIAKSRRDGLLWRTGSLWIRSNGAALGWQYGEPVFVPTAQLRLGKYQVMTSGTWNFTTLASAPLGTTVEMADETLDVVFNEVVINSTTTIPYRTPLIHLAHGYQEPGDRTGLDDDVVFDTDDFLPERVIAEITPRFEQGRRLCLDVRMRNIEGQTTAAFPEGHTAFENLTADVYIDGVRVLYRALIRTAGHDGMETPRQLAETDEMMNLECQTWQFVDDQQSRLEEIVMEDVRPVGDGLKLGLYVMQCLQLAGVPGFAFFGQGTAQMAGIFADGPNAGIRLPRARPGEGWRVQPAPGTDLFSWIHRCVALWGMGREFWVDGDGIFHVDFRTTAVQAAFTPGSGADQIFRPLAVQFDTTANFRNQWRVEGGIGPDGVPLVATYTKWESVLPNPSGPNHPTYVGRILAAPVLRDEAFVTQGQCNSAVRSLARQAERQTPHFKTWSFSGYKRLTLQPQHHITAHGVEMALSRSDGGALSFGADGDYAGRVQITAMEIIPEPD